MKVWMVYTRVMGDNTETYQELYTNKESAESRAEYIEENFYMEAFVTEIEVLDNPAKGYPKM